MKGVRIISGFILLTYLVAVVPVGAFAQKASGEVEMAVPTAILVPGTPTCADLNASSDAAFAHITEDWGMRVNRSGVTPFDQVFAFVNGPDTVLMGGAGPGPSSQLRVAAGGATMSWVSNRELTAVIVQGPTGANVYPYAPNSRGGFPGGDGSGLLSPGGCATIVNMTFCFQSLAPTAAPVSVSGRVVKSDGEGISGARLTLTNAQSGATWVATTNPFGYFTIEGVPVGSFYTLTVSHSRYSFPADTQTFSLSESVSGIIFTAAP